MTGARTSKRLEQYDGDILPRSINPSPNSNPNSTLTLWMWLLESITAEWA